MQPQEPAKPERPDKRPRRFAVRVVCDSIKEAALIERGLRDPEIVALCKVMGALSTLPDADGKRLALDLVDRVLKRRDANRAASEKKDPF